MKILLVTGIFPPDIGGPASYVPRIGAELAKRHDVSVFTLGNHEDTHENFPFKVRRISKIGNASARRVKTVRGIRSAAQYVDVVLANGLFFETALALRKKVPSIAKVVGDTVWERARNRGDTEVSLDDFQRDQGLLHLRIFHYLQSLSMRTYKKIFTPSKYLRDVVEKWGVSGHRLSVIPNAVEPSASFNQSPELDLVCVSRLVPWKGVFELVRLAVSNNWSLLLIGDGPLRSDLETFLKNEPNNKVEIRGVVPREQVTREIQRGRIFILNSSYEGLPHVVLEAQAAGVPVVATRAGGTPECVQNGLTGCLVEVGDIDQLRETISSLLGDPLRRDKLVDAALNGIRTRFSFQQMIAKTEMLLTEAAGH
jgi:glycosyltransferase involved in cell wall biosynthesis